MLIFCLPIVFSVVVYSLYLYFTRTFNYWKKRNVAGPEPTAFYGNLKEFTFRRKNLSVLYREFYDLFPDAQVVGIYRMTTPCLLIRDLDIIKHIMIKDFDQFSDRGLDMNDTTLRQNLFHSVGNTWGTLRTLFSPIFTSGKLKGMFHLINDCAENLISYLDDTRTTKIKYDITTLAQKYTMSSISTCAFGVHLNNFYYEANDTLQNLNKMVFTPTYAVEFNFMYPGILKNLNLSFGLTKVRKFFEQLVSSVILQRNGKPSGRGDFMDIILQIREMGEVRNIKNKDEVESTSTKITDDMIAAQAFVFYMAGYETSSITVGNMLYQLALHPEIQDKLREEIDSVTKAHGLALGEITYDSLMDMKYLEKIFCETLRMYPIVDPLQRRALTDYRIPDTDVVIKKDMIVLVSILSIHYDEKYYPNPEVFDPERFDAKEAGSRNPCAYIPFGIGPRNCIGRRFGALQTRLCVAKIISRFQVEPSECTKTSISFHPNRVILAPAENIYLNIKLRVF